MYVSLFMLEKCSKCVHVQLHVISAEHLALYCFHLIALVSNVGTTHNNKRNLDSNANFAATSQVLCDQRNQYMCNQWLHQLAQVWQNKCLIMKVCMIVGASLSEPHIQTFANYLYMVHPLHANCHRHFSALRNLAIYFNIKTFTLSV